MTLSDCVHDGRTTLCIALIIGVIAVPCYVIYKAWNMDEGEERN